MSLHATCAEEIYALRARVAELERVSARTDRRQHEPNCKADGGAQMTDEEMIEAVDGGGAPAQELLEKLLAKIAELERERDEARGVIESRSTAAKQLGAENVRLHRALAKAREALESIAGVGRFPTPVVDPEGRARAALAKIGGK